MGLPRKLTPERTDRIVEAILAGARLDSAAQHGGIAASTHHDWVAKGEAALTEAGGELATVEDPEKHVYAEYAWKIDDARHRWEMGQVAAIQKAGSLPYQEITEEYDSEGKLKSRKVVTKAPQWAAIMTLLERRLPQHYGRRYRTELTGADGGPIEMSMDELVERGRRAIDELAARRDRRTG